MNLKTDLKEHGYEGYVTLKIADAIEQLEVFEELGIEDLASLTTEVMTSTFTKTKNVIKLIRMSKDSYVEVNLEKDGKKISSFDELKQSGQGSQMALMTCAKLALIGLGEDEKKSKS